jgi:hypothetical protein
VDLCCVTLTDSFLDAVSALDRNSMRRVGGFISKLLTQASPTGLRPEIVHEAGDRSIRSYRITRELRAIARVQGMDVALLYAGPHEEAYAWASRRCIECEESRHRVRLRDREDLETSTLLAEWECVDEDDLCRLFDERGLEHGLR